MTSDARYEQGVRGEGGGFSSEEKVRGSDKLSCSRLLAWEWRGAFGKGLADWLKGSIETNIP